MQDLLFQEIYQKQLKKAYLIFAICCVALLSVVYTPIYLLLYSNVIWQNSVVLFLWTELVKPLVDFAFYWGSFAFLIYIFLRFGKVQTKFFVIIYAVAAVARYFLTTLVSYLLMSFPGWDTIWEEELPMMLFSSVMDCLQVVGILLLTEFCCRRPLMRRNAYLKGEAEKKMFADCFPIEGLFDWKKPLPKLCLLASLIPAGLKILSRLYYDLFFWGMPQDITDLLLVITYYVSDIAALLIGYFVLLYVLQAFLGAENKSQIAFESE